jgi:hypothetical protein
MARTFAQIKTEIKAEIRTNTAFDNFLFVEDGGSALSVFNGLIDVSAAMIQLTEVVFDAFQNTITSIADRAASGNSQWIRQQMFNFQNGDVIELDSDYVPFYSVPDDLKKIITRAAVSERSGGGIDIKIAKGVPPSLTALSAPELQAVKDYWFGTTLQEGVGFAGISTNFISSDPDRMKIAANIYYQGQYVDATVKTNVIAAIDNFFATFSDDAFDGTVFIIRLTDAIQAVAGVSRVEYTEIKGRDSATAFASAALVDFQSFYRTQAGYLIAEDTAGETLADTITMVLETI